GVGFVFDALRAITGADVLGVAHLNVSFNAFMLPAPFTDAEAHLYPANPPAWSLGLEILANLVFAAVAPKLTTRRLAAFVAVSAVLMVVAVGMHGHLSVGAS